MGFDHVVMDKCPTGQSSKVNENRRVETSKEDDGNDLVHDIEDVIYEEEEDALLVVKMEPDSGTNSDNENPVVNSPEILGLEVYNNHIDTLADAKGEFNEYEVKLFDHLAMDKNPTGQLSHQNEETGGESFTC